METHGKNPEKNVVAIIPARYKSTRLEGKLLLPLGGKPLILHTLERTREAKSVSRAIVATDEERILRVVKEAGGEAILTSEEHQSGSDRIAEIAKTLPEGSIIANVQGDEPLISPQTIDKAVAGILEDQEADISTTCEMISDLQDVISPDVVKVVSDKNGYALYFSRSPIPYPRKAVSEFGSLENALRSDQELLKRFRKHTGLYVFRREFLLEFTGAQPSLLERTEMLEQLRALDMAAKILVVEVSEGSIGVDTRLDLERVEALLTGN
ncbi:MAG: 3-deoxy-manno-octulosonate cytidylyltransferase [Pyrinomonadaceae bacterium]|nr:3-deoxy-manno-octulosonate cytidylyltransferase [Pyrinomonadaceae bacterium]